MMNGYEYTDMDAILAGSFRAAIYCRLSKDDDLDGELDATDVFVSLISQKYGKTNTKEYLAKKKDMSYNEDEVQKSQIPSGLCG